MSSSTAAAAAASAPVSSPLPSPAAAREALGARKGSWRSLSSANAPPRTPSPRPRSHDSRHKSKGKQPDTSVDDDVDDEDNDNDNDNADTEAVFPASAAIPDAPRHSHGLSWNSTTCDLVVENLLLGLDNLSRPDLGGMGEQATDDYERNRYLDSIASQFAANSRSNQQPRHRGHAQSPSLSETSERRPVESPVGKPSSVSPRERRSTSTTNPFSQTLAGKVKSGSRAFGIGRSSSDIHTRSDAEAGGADLALAAVGLDPNRVAWPTHLTGADHLPRKGSTDAPRTLDRGRALLSSHGSKLEPIGDLDAAPEPSVAGGPRKMQNPTATGPVYVNPVAGKGKQSTTRKLTTPQQDTWLANRLPSPAIPDEIRNQAAHFVRTNSMIGSVPPPPAPASAAPSPAPINRRREPSPPRDRPGFFKRVFGGTSRTVSQPVERPSSNQTPQQENADPRTGTARPTPPASAGGLQSPRSGAKQAAAGDMSVAAAPTATTTATAIPPPPPPPQSTLNKKPSSFFRRRKKSSSEAAVPPPPPPPQLLPLAADAAVSKGSGAGEIRPSTGSRGRIMDPSLGQDTLPDAVLRNSGPASQTQDYAARPTTADSKNEDLDGLDIFHTGYTPPPSLSGEHALKLASGRQGDNASKMKVKKRKPEPLVIYAKATSAGNDSAQVSPISVEGPEIPQEPSHERRPSTGDRLLASHELSPVAIAGRDMREFSASNNVSLDMNEEGWVVTRNAHLRPESKKSERLRLQPTPSEEHIGLDTRNLSPLNESRKSSDPSADVDTASGAQLAKQLLSDVMSPMLNDDISATLGTLTSPATVTVQSAVLDEGAEYRERARRIFDGDEEEVSRADAAAWMGERNTLNTRTLQAYMQLFDFHGLNILASLRTLCLRLTLRGETQQFDRIITALSERWCECNPNHGFKAQDVVHTIIYSLILLNTDLHLADIGEKMSRSAYVKNTLPTIRRVVLDAAPNAFDETLRPTPVSQPRPSIPWTLDSNPFLPVSPVLGRSGTPIERSDSSFSDYAQLNAPSAYKRLSIRPSVSRADSDNATPDSAMGGSMDTFVNSPWPGFARGWEMEIEAVLKSFFTSIKAEPLPLHSVAKSEQPSGTRNLAVANGNASLKRTGSIVSRTPSENPSFRSKGDFRSLSMRWQNRGANRSKQKLYPASTIGSSRTSLDDGSSLWSPALSGKYSRTLTSASVNSFGHFSGDDAFKHSIGFANALSQAIIREENATDSESFSASGGLLEEESLALEGAPWAKEGLVKHKHHLETQDRKAKDRNWNECFAVISKGKLTLFAFNTSSKTQSMARKNHFGKAGKAASVTGARVGGGDWMENAEQLEVLVLRQTIASTLPSPGYSKTRPHVWALSLPSGAVHLFQVGTPEIASEFMTTANYWSARLSKEPLAGGVSNIEYGWSENVVNAATAAAASNNSPESFPHPPSSLQSRQRGHGHGHSMSSGHSISSGHHRRRSSAASHGRASIEAGGSRVRPGDRLVITEWQPPTQSMMASQLMEIDQLRQLTAYVRSQQDELEKHNELKGAIELAYSPRHPNAAKALANWQRKSDYLLREIVKFHTYVDSLTAGQKAKEAFYAKKAEGRLSPFTPAKDREGEEGADGTRSLTAAAAAASPIGLVGVARREVYTSG